MAHSVNPIPAVVAALKQEKLIPDLIPEGFQPTVLFSATFPSGREVVMGSKIPRNETMDEPQIVLAPLLYYAESGVKELRDIGPREDVSYTLVMADPDAPSRNDPKFGPWRHWVVAGLKLPESIKSGSVIALKTKPATASYWPPGPASGTGFHRYTFLLFKEPGDSITIPQGAPEHGTTLQERRSWNPMAFAEKYGLELVGVNFFLTEAEE